MPLGRPITKNVKENPDYFVEYYKENCEKYVCECGLLTDKFSASRHKKTRRHIDGLMIKDLKKQVEKLG